MTGVRIRRPSGRSGVESDFAAFFAPVLPQLRGLVWLVDDQAFRLPDERPDAEYAAFDARRRWVAAEGDDPLGGCVDPHFAAGPGFVPDYAGWCTDDWARLYGFDRPPPDWRDWLRAGRKTGANWQAERAAFLAKTTAVCFFAVDFCYWEFFAHDAVLVEDATAAAGTGGLWTEPTSLAESAGL